MATLDGTYVFAQDGVQVTGSNKVPFALAGIEVFDGDGHSHGFLSQGTNERISRRVSFTSTYTVNPDYTGTETITDATGAVTHYAQYSLPSGSQFMFLQTDPGIVSSAVEAKKVS